MEAVARKAIAEYRAFLERYRDDPVSYVRDVKGMEPYDWQAEVMDAVAAIEPAPDLTTGPKVRPVNRKIAIKSGHGVGKTQLLAWITEWTLLFRAPCKVAVTAPGKPQLHDAFLPTVKESINDLPKHVRESLEVQSERIQLAKKPEYGFMQAKTARAENPEALQGVHRHDGWVLLLADEASGIAEEVFDAASGSLQGPRSQLILTGNPVRGSGYFYDAFHRLATHFKRWTVSCFDIPNPNLEEIEDKRLRYGEDGNGYRVRVLGLFPKADDDTVIPLELIEPATGREVEPNPFAPVVWGLDVARFGDDRSVLCKRRQNEVVEPLRTWKNRDTMQLVGEIVNEYNSTPHESRPEEIMVDSIGMGAGVADRLRELGLPARDVNVAESPALSAQYLNLRAELWYQAREWFNKRNCRIPNDKDLVAELSTVRYEFTSSGKTKIESKSDLKKRGLQSPDLADAFILTFAGAAATARDGFAGSQRWKKPIKRRIRGIV